MLTVVEVRAWQSRSETTGTGTPAASMVVAMKVPEVVQPEGGQAGAAAVGDEALGHPVAPPRMTPGVGAEHEPVDHAVGPGGRPVAVGEQQLDAPRIERHAVGAPVLGGPHDWTGGPVNQ